MPIYEYEMTTPPGCETCRQPFEVFQSMAEPALEKCPACGGPIRRLISTGSIHGAKSSHGTLSNSNLAEKGFTKYQKTSDGSYEKVAGKKGPDRLEKS